MRPRAGWPVWLLAAISVHALAAQSARIRIVPDLRGNISVIVRTQGMKGERLDTIRSAAFPCDWRLEDSGEGFLEGTCRRYLHSDGASADGPVELAPLILALHQAGAMEVHVQLNDFGRPLAEPPAGWQAQTHSPKTLIGSLKSTSYWFDSFGDTQLPAPIRIRIGTPASSAPLAVPFVFTLFGPALLALWLRRRAERQGTVQTASVWVHWILTGAWLYWISAVSVADLGLLAVRLQLDSMALTFLIGAALFSAPPLLATASCIAVLMPPAQSDERRGTLRLVARSVAGEAVFLVPFGMFLMGGALFKQSWEMSLAFLPLAWLTYKVLGWCVAHWSARRIERVSQGALLTTAQEIAQNAGVKLGGLFVIENRSAREANAFASRGNVLAMTRGLVERLTRRELTAVIGHEIGHMRGKHVGWRMGAFWCYVIVIGPLASGAIERLGLPHWILSLPLMPIAYILAASLLSRNHEFAADAAAVRLVDDPEGMIAALARLSSMTRTPVNWGGIQGAILSHPSMRRRVLAVANRFGVAEERALALLHDPDLLAGHSLPEELHFELPPECRGDEPVFSSRSRAAYQMWARWAGNVALALITLGAAHFALKVWPRPPYVRVGLLFGLPLIAWAYLAFDWWLDGCYFRVLRARLRQRIGATAQDGEFVGLLPRGCVSVEGGFYAWDIGFLWLTPDALEYVGERASFSVAREAVNGIEVARGPLCWIRAYGVVISSAEGSFGFSARGWRLSRRNARKLRGRLEAWRSGRLTEAGRGRPSQAWRPAPQGCVPQLPADGYTRGWDAVRFHLLRAAMLWLGLSILMPLSVARWAVAAVFVPFMTPLAYLFAVCPSFFRTKPRVISARSGSAGRKEGATPVPAPGGVLH